MGAMDEVVKMGICGVFLVAIFIMIWIGATTTPYEEEK